MQERVTIASGGLLLPAAGFAVGDSGYAAFAVRWGDEKLLSSKSERAWTFDGAITLPFTFANGATGVTSSGRNALYFLARTGARIGLQRAMFDEGVLGAASPVVVDGVGGVPSWPQAVGLADGRVLLAFVVPQSEVLAGVDDGTGMHFSVAHVPLVETNLLGVLAHVGVTARGSWVLTYQVADARWNYRSHVLLSRDEGASWSEADGGRLADGNVLDAFPIARTDEGADVYYVKKGATEQQYTHIRHEEHAVWRRALHEDGSLGPEQAVTSDTFGYVANPQPRRLRGGRIAMLVALEHSATEKDLALVVLDGDAP
jgi:hypothetical protein